LSTDSFAVARRLPSADIVYEIEFASGSEHFAATLGKMSCVEKLEISGRTVTVNLENWECLAEVVSALNGAVLRRISLREKTLEEVFFSLTGEGVRE